MQKPVDTGERVAEILERDAERAFASRPATRQALAVIPAVLLPFWNSFLRRHSYDNARHLGAKAPVPRWS